ncbi:MAG: polyprenyl synthetase family protein [Proteobacteria bacterium]|nr:polyprenyl synthetase family protein [Pseudomonadota bacterium]
MNGQNGGPDSVAAKMKVAAVEIEGALDNLLPRSDGPEGRLYEAMRYAVLVPAKRLRPILVLAGADLFNVSRNSALRVAAAVELVHTYSLLHDDLPCMDDDAMRRGQPATHLKFDEATAVLAGDALLPLAFQVLADPDTHADAGVRAELCLDLAQAVGGHGMVGGQAIDLAMQQGSANIGTITRAQQLKTGALIAFSAESGAILAQAAPQLRHALHAFSHDLGLAFQIVDDLLDAEGEEAAMGKGVRKDAAAGKATFVSLLGADRARTQAGILASQAVEHLEPFAANGEFLRSLAQFVVQRNR